MMIAKVLYNNTTIIITIMKDVSNARITRGFLCTRNSRRVTINNKFLCANYKVGKKFYCAIAIQQYVSNKNAFALSSPSQLILNISFSLSCPPSSLTLDVVVASFSKGLSSYITTTARTVQYISTPLGAKLSIKGHIYSR